jgi:hypothetical protein
MKVTTAPTAASPPIVTALLALLRLVMPDLRTLGRKTKINALKASRDVKEVMDLDFHFVRLAGAIDRTRGSQGLRRQFRRVQP